MSCKKKEIGNPERPKKKNQKEKPENVAQHCNAVLESRKKQKIGERAHIKVVARERRGERLWGVCERLSSEKIFGYFV